MVVNVEDAGAITGQITGTDLDGLHPVTPYMVSGVASNGTATVDVNGNWSYTPMLITTVRIPLKLL